MEERIERIKSVLPKKFFFEKEFESNHRNKILANVSLCYDKVEHNNILNCSPLLNKTQEQQLFRKYNYLKYRLCKLTVGFEHIKFKGRKPKKSKPVNIYRLGEKSLNNIENIIYEISEIRNILIKSNTRLVVKQLSRLLPEDSFDRDELFSNSYCHIMRAIDCFDYRKRFKFSTYLVHVLRRNLWQDLINLKKHRSKTEQSECVYEVCDKKEVDLSKHNIKYNKEVIKEIFACVKKGMKRPDEKILILKEYFGIDCEAGTLKSLAEKLSLTKERIRQIKLEALKFAKDQIKYDPLV